MKKALALLLAMAATMSIGVTVLADDESSSSSEASSSESSSEASSSEASSSDVSSSEASSSEESSSQVVDPTLDPSALVFGADEDGVILGDTILEPDTEYKFPVYVKVGDAQTALNDDYLDNYKFTYSKVSSASVSKFKIEEYKGVYYLYVTTKSTVPTEEVELEYNIKMVKKSTNLSIFTQKVKFYYGYSETNGDYIKDLDEGDAIEIDNAKPVITASQFDKIAKINNYKNVTLEGSSWKFTVNVTDESTKNFVSNNAGIKEVLAKFADQDFKFYNFPGKPSFAATGKVALDVEDIVDDFAKLYTYRYADGKLYRLNATYNEEDETLEFRTKTLDNFVVTDKLIEDGTVVVEDTDTDTDTDTDKGNPSTGANDMINAAVMAAIASLAAAGVAAVKKASK